MTKPAVVLIGADKGGVGKTTVARTLLDYFAHHQVRVRAFDTEVPRGTLKRFHPNVTDVVDINYVPDQMRIFDTVNSTDATVSLIDVRAGLLSPTLRALRNIGFIEAAKKGEITFVVFHILGPSIASLDEIAETAAYLGDAKYFMVKNSINNAHFFEWDEATHMAYFKTVPRAVEITIPNLVEMATEQVELASVPFAIFIANKKQGGDPASYSFVLRGYVRHWLGNVWAEYDRVGLTDVVDAKIVDAKQEVLGAPLRTSRDPLPLPGDQPPGLHAAGRKLVRP
jgi:CobQ/CobB/MinD/ParA nucleotide binding domain